MAKGLKGVGGVLGNLLSPEPAPPPEAADIASPLPPAQAEPPAIIEQPPPPAESPRPKPQARIATRRGRPPGKKEAVDSEKEKVTLRLSKALVDDYRDWTWEERCQLGELIERAMQQYRKHRRQKSQ